MNTSPIPPGRQSKFFGDKIIRDEAMLMGLNKLAQQANRGPRALTPDLIRQRIQTKLDLEYAISIKNGPADEVVNKLLAASVPREDLIETAVVEIVEGQLKSFFMASGLLQAELAVAIETMREVVGALSERAASLKAFWTEHQTEGVLSALWKAHNFDLPKDIYGGIDRERAAGTLIKDGQPGGTNEHGFVNVSMLGEANERIAESRGTTVEQMANDHLEHVAESRMPSERQFSEIIAGGKKRRKGTAGYIIAGESLGFVLVASDADPKVRENWKVA